MPKEANSRVCFVIAPIGEEGDETRHRSDQVLKHIIQPVVAECGYKAIRADKIPEPGIITSQIIQHLVEDSIVIADLTGRNPNVYYELAIRHAVKKPVVQIIQAGESIPFDVATMRTISFDYRDLDSVDRCKEELIKQIRSIERDPSQVYNPISLAIDLQFLRRSDNPVEKSNAEIVSMLHSLQDTIRDLIPPLQTVKSHQTSLFLKRSVPFIVRSRVEIIYEILSVCLKPVQKTHILYRCNLSYSQLQKYIGSLVSSENLMVFEKRGVVFHQTTGKGKEFLKNYERLKSLLLKGADFA